MKSMESAMPPAAAEATTEAPDGSAAGGEPCPELADLLR